MATERATSALLLFLLVLAVSMFAATEAADDCLSGLSSTDIPFDFSNVTCETVWEPEGYELAYKKNGSIWSFVLSAPNKNVYVGVGFSDAGKMQGSSAVVGWIASGRSFAWQYRLNSYLSVIPNDGDLALVNGTTTLVLKSNRLYLGFQLRLPTGEPKSNIICALGPANFVPSTNNSLSHHQGRTAYQIKYDFGSSTESPSAPSPNSPPPANSMAMKLDRSGFAATVFGSVAVYLAMRLL